MLTPRLPDDRCLLISDGSLGALVLTALLSEARREEGEPSLIYPGWWGETEDLDALIPLVDRSLEQAAAFGGFELVRDRAGYPDLEEIGAARGAVVSGMHRTRLLLDACAVAIEHGIRTVVWSVQIRDDDEDRLTRVGDAIDRALLAARLATLDAEERGGIEVRMLTPIVDLADDQVLDLATDLSVPVESGWWRGPDHPIAERERGRWSPAPSGADASV